MGVVCKVLVVLLLGICAVKDIKERQFLVLPPILVGVIVTFIQVLIFDYTLIGLCSGVLVGLLLILISFITKGKIGMGDGILVCITGLTYGFWENLEMLYYALLVAAVISLVLLISKKCTKHSSLPFVPFLFASYLITCIWR